jgi:hypothetical protein
MVEAKDDWCLDFIAYIVEKRVPEDKVEREKIIWRCDNPPRKIPYYRLNQSTLVIER